MKLFNLQCCERVFKTPMTFSPRLVGNGAKPSPSRCELWKQQLGFDGGYCSTHSNIPILPDLEFDCVHHRAVLQNSVCIES